MISSSADSVLLPLCQKQVSPLCNPYLIRSNLKDTHKATRRHHRRRRRTDRATTFLVALLFAATAAVTWQFARPRPLRASPRRIPRHRHSRKSFRSTQSNPFTCRRCGSSGLSYSIVPGGVGSVEELRRDCRARSGCRPPFRGLRLQECAPGNCFGKPIVVRCPYRQGEQITGREKGRFIRESSSVTEIGARTPLRQSRGCRPAWPSGADGSFALRPRSAPVLQRNGDQQCRSAARSVRGDHSRRATDRRERTTPAKSHKGLIPLFSCLWLAYPAAGSSSHPL